MHHHPVHFGINIPASSVANTRTSHGRTLRDARVVNPQSIVLSSAKKSILEKENTKRVAMHWQSCGLKGRGSRSAYGMVLTRNQAARVQIHLMMTTKTPKDHTTNMLLLVNSGTIGLKNSCKSIQLNTASPCCSWSNCSVGESLGAVAVSNLPKRNHLIKSVAGEVCR